MVLAELAADGEMKAYMKEVCYVIFFCCKADRGALERDVGAV